MLSILRNRDYRQLFAAQVVALIGTGLATVALSLMAHELAGEAAGTVLATALTIKMVAYVFVSPVLAALFQTLPRKTVLVALDLLRALTALSLPFVTEVWQVFAIIFVLQACSSGFTPLLQSVIPDILPDQEDYTRALSLSRLAYDLESLLSPALAALLLLLVSWHALFLGTALGFLASAVLVVSTVLPKYAVSVPEHWRQRLTRGMRIFLHTPRLRGLFLLNLAAAMGGAMVIVNTVVMVQSELALSAQDTAIALATFGGGSMLAALLLPTLSAHATDRRLMLCGVAVLLLGQIIGSQISAFAGLLACWPVMGFGYALVLTPTGKVLTRSCRQQDRAALFAAQFSLSHLGWLAAYPAAGWLYRGVGMELTFLLFAGLSIIAGLLAAKIWRADEPEEIGHTHPELPDDHEHHRLVDAHGQHAHNIVIDELHPSWPR